MCSYRPPCTNAHYLFKSTIMSATRIPTAMDKSEYFELVQHANSRQHPGCEAHKIDSIVYPPLFVPADDRYARRVDYAC